MQHVPRLQESPRTIHSFGFGPPTGGSAEGAATGEVGAPSEKHLTPSQLHPGAFLHLPPLGYTEHWLNAVGFGVGAGEGGSVGAFVGCDDKKMVVNEIIKEINLKK